MVAGAGSMSAPAMSYDRDDAQVGLSPEALVKIAILAPLFAAVYWIVLRWLWDKTNPIWGEANWGHAICIPFVGLYFLFINREDLMKEPVEPLLAGNFANKARLYPAFAMLGFGALLALIGPRLG